MHVLQMKVFKTVVEKGSFSKAADVLYMTQSSVSQHIQQLEGYYGVKLFDRLYRQIRITTAGEVLYPYAVAVEQLYLEAEKALQNIRDEVSGRIQIGASLTIGEYVLPGLLVNFRQKYANVDIGMDVYNTDQVITRVAKDDVDIGFVEGPFYPVEHITGFRCGGDSLIIIAPPCSVYSEVPVALESIINENWVLREQSSGTRKVFEEYLALHGHSLTDLKIVMELGSTQAIKEAVMAGLGVSVISSLAVVSEIKSGKLCKVELAGQAISRNFTMIYRQGKFQTRAVEEFIKFASQGLTNGALDVKEGQ